MNRLVPGSLKIYKRLFTVMGIVAALVGLLVSSADASQSSSFITKVGLGWFTASGQYAHTCEERLNGVVLQRHVGDERHHLLLLRDGVEERRGKQPLRHGSNHRALTNKINS